MSKTILHIDASAQTGASNSRALSAELVDQLGADRVIRRDLNNSLPHVSEAWVGANFTPADNRSGDQQQALAQSDALIGEVTDADTIVIGTPIYNFSIPASLKAWIDMIVRAGVTFAYTEDGPKGLLPNKKVIIVITSGGTKLGSDIDFASGYLRFVFGFLGLTDVEFVAADQLSMDAEGSLAKARQAISELAA